MNFVLISITCVRDKENSKLLFTGSSKSISIEHVCNFSLQFMHVVESWFHLLSYLPTFALLKIYGETCTVGNWFLIGYLLSVNAWLVSAHIQGPDVASIYLDTHKTAVYPWELHCGTHFLETQNITKQPIIRDIPHCIQLTCPTSSTMFQFNAENLACE